MLRNGEVVSVAEKLTALQKRFIDEYLIDLNATQAAIRAGYSEKTAHSIGPANLQKPAVARCVKRRMEARVERTEITQDFVLLELAKIAKADGTKFASVDENGEVKFASTEELAPEERAAIAGIKAGRFGAELKTYDKVKALELLGRHLGLFDRAQGAQSDGLPVVPDAVWRELMNPAYAEHLTDERPTQIYFGGSSSGKSYGILAQRTVRDMCRGERNYLILRKTARTIRNSCYNEIVKCINRMDLAGEFKINQSDLAITHKASGRQILFGGLDDVEKVKSITPAAGVITDILVEEATEIEYNDYKSLVKRLRGRCEVPKRMALLFNPVTQDHWIYTEFFAGRFDDETGAFFSDELGILRTTYKDNRFLAQEDIDRLENEEDKYYYDVYTLGRWGVLGRLIFTNWEIRDLSEAAKAEAQPKNGLDFGFFPDPNAFVRCGLNRRKKEVYVYRTEGANYQDNRALADMLQPIVKNETVRCDKDLLNIQELNSFGVRAIPARKGPGSVEFGIQFLRRMKICVDPSCADLIRELRAYKYKEDRNGNILPEPVDQDNHWIDAMRYALEDDMLETKVS